MLTLRSIGPDDYSVHEDGHLIGRIRRDDRLWLWTVVVTLPGPPAGDAATQGRVGELQSQARA
ncbi:hypothetical protein [Bradyrhizobium sp. CCBAU 11434]|uniref:hypothetical protein n=1 Tax=Bradyrhizobium sp. CCBAU 11434 TaxID=1630885 RepID=UPI002306CE7D|nr:hypothetical protein [Bradyrhizobium sp. CCBAU 11434]